MKSEKLVVTTLTSLMMFVAFKKQELFSQKDKLEKVEVSKVGLN